MNTMNVSNQFISRIYESATAPLTQEVEEEARRCLLDFTGACVGGSSVLGEKAEQFLAGTAPSEGATVINRGKRTSLENAALLNGMMAHVFDIDDGNRLTSIHLGAPVISAILALAEWNDLTIGDVLRGIAVGYEAANRLGKCIQPFHRKRGFHASGTCGTIGAALGAAAAMHYTKEEMKTVLSAACTAAAGILQMQEDSSTLKPFNIGRAAHDAVTCVLMTKAGFVGPEDPLMGKFGFVKAVADNFDLSYLTAPLARRDGAEDAEIAEGAVKELPENLTVLGSYHKIHASCRHTHGAVDAARAIMAEHPEKKPSDIKGITIRMYEQGVKGHDHTEVTSPVSGKMSIPFATALAIVKGSVGFTSFTDENIFDSEVQQICKSSKVIVDDALTAQAPGIREAIVTIDFGSETAEKSVKFPKGEPEYPLTAEDIRAKFADLATCGGLAPEKITTIADFILTCEKASPVRRLFDFM